MREILFRGKRVDNGEWIEGVPIINEVGDMVIVESLFECEEYLCNGANAYYVDENSIGQYTGLTDKNGEKIFEGDIVKTTTLDTGDERKAVVGFGNFVDENNDDEYIGLYIEFDGIKTTITQLAIEEVKDRFEIIGNIHDNPELLKVNIN